jgi:hypothetical protein
MDAREFTPYDPISLVTAPRGAAMEPEQNEIVAELIRLNRVRQVAVVLALGLLIVSLVAPNPALAVARSIAWAAAGVVSWMHAAKAKQAGLPANYMSAIIYFLVALVPLLRGR